MAGCRASVLYTFSVSELRRRLGEATETMRGRRSLRWRYGPNCLRADFVVSLQPFSPHASHGSVWVSFTLDLSSTEKAVMGSSVQRECFSLDFSPLLSYLPYWPAYINGIPNKALMVVSIFTAILTQTGVFRVKSQYFSDSLHIAAAAAIPADSSQSGHKSPQWGGSAIRSLPSKRMGWYKIQRHLHSSFTKRWNEDILRRG